MRYRHAPLCKNHARTKGYCDSCKALRRLLDRIHRDTDHAMPDGWLREAEDTQRRIELHRRKVAR